MSVKVPLQDVTVEEKNDAAFECQLSKPNLEATWYFKGKKIKPDDKFTTECDGNTYRLKIKSCELSDANDAVSITFKDAKSTAKLIVTGRNSLLLWKCDFSYVLLWKQALYCLLLWKQALYCLLLCAVAVDI